MMITDAPPKKANREGFLESDRIETLENATGRDACSRAVEDGLAEDESGWLK